MRLVLSLNILFLINFYSSIVNAVSFHISDSILLSHCITDSMDMSLRENQETVMEEKPGMLQQKGWQREGYDIATEQ